MTTTYDQTAAAIIEAFENSSLAFKGAVLGVKEALLLDNDLTVEDEDGNIVGSLGEVKKTAFEAIVKAVVRTREERATIGLSRDDLFAAVFPNHPDEPNDIEKAAMQELRRTVWGITQTLPGSYVQRQLDNGYVLAKATVKRGHDPVEVVFVADDDDLILTHSLQPEVDGIVKQSLVIGAKSTMLVLRRPSLDAAARSAIKAGTKKVALNALPAAHATGDAELAA